MAQSPRINITQIQRLQLNMSLHSSIRMLRYDAAGLTRYLAEASADNPYLRLDPAPVAAPGEWLPRWHGVLPGGSAGLIDAAESAAPSLIAHVMAEIEPMLSTGSERRIALMLAEALEPSGWLGRPVKAIAAEAMASVAEVEAVLVKLQRIEPAGLFARDLAECLRLQLIESGQFDAVMEDILRHLDLLARGDMERLARQCHSSVAEVSRRFRLIRGLDPKPGVQFQPIAAAGLREPDLIVRRAAGSGWDIELNRSSLPVLRIEATAGKNPGKGDKASGGSLAEARSIERMLSARNATLLRVGREILARQSAALEAGSGALVPMTMAEVASTLDLHESTISRVVAGAAVDTPRGTWWLRALFGGAVAGGSSAAFLRERLARLVAAEDRAAPLSDIALTRLLAEDGTGIARRTVAKYREALSIPPAHRRKRHSPGGA